MTLTDLICLKCDCDGPLMDVSGGGPDQDPADRLYQCRDCGAHVSDRDLEEYEAWLASPHQIVDICPDFGYGCDCLYCENRYAAEESLAGGEAGGA